MKKQVMTIMETLETKVTKITLETIAEDYGLEIKSLDDSIRYYQKIMDLMKETLGDIMDIYDTELNKLNDKLDLIIRKLDK